MSSYISKISNKAGHSGNFSLILDILVSFKILAGIGEEAIDNCLKFNEQATIQ